MTSFSLSAAVEKNCMMFRLMTFVFWLVMLVIEFGILKFQNFALYLFD